MTHTPQLDQPARPAAGGHDGATVTTPTAPGFLWLEITGKCQLACTHCYAGSSPAGSHGTMTPADWHAAISAAAGAGTSMVQFIGGEPTLHPALPGLLGHALGCGLKVEVYTNLVHVTPALWDAFTRPGVSLATSWYTSDRAQHRQITGRDTWRQTWANMIKARNLGIRLRAGLITGIVPGQRGGEAAAMFSAAGIAWSADPARPLGRGTRPDPAALCGACGDGIAAIGPDGEIHPCPMARWVTAGNIRDGLPAPAAISATARQAGIPARIGPQACAPDICLPNCTPSTHNCKPHKAHTPEQ